MSTKPSAGTTLFLLAQERIKERASGGDFPESQDWSSDAGCRISVPTHWDQFPLATKSRDECRSTAPQGHCDHARRHQCRVKDARQIQHPKRSLRLSSTHGSLHHAEYQADE